ncbi:hypothetical protein MMC18_001884 [Xylographa bjoerkii]|nr:hypothetical protein [Xylographa bjoerkii]
MADTLLIFLMPALVNLQSIHLMIHSSADVLIGLAKLLSTTGPAIKSVQILPNLRYCTLESVRMYGATKIISTVITGFALLPSLKGLFLKEVWGLTDDDFEWPQSRISKVTELSLRSCKLSHNALRNLLSRFQGLESFELNYQNVNHVRDFAQPNEVVNALPRSVRHTLEHLTLRVQPIVERSYSTSPFQAPLRVQISKDYPNGDESLDQDDFGHRQTYEDKTCRPPPAIY